MSKKSIIVIGSGLGGLMTGALLSKEGYNVTVLEKNSSIGGELHSYKRHGALFDTGMNVLGGMDDNGNVRRVLDYLGVTSKIPFIPLDIDRNAEIYVAEDDMKYDVDFSASGIVDSFAQYFPDCRNTLLSYKKALIKVMDDFDLFHLRPERRDIIGTTSEFAMPADDFIYKYIQNPKLSSLLSSINVLYAGEAGISPAYLHAAISMLLFHGASRIKGGYSSVAEQLREVIYKYGGNIYINECVESIMTDDSLAKSVRTSSGKSFSADYVISAISPASTISMVNKTNFFSKAYRTVVQNKKDSDSAFIINIKLKDKALAFSNRLGLYLQSYESAWHCSDGKTIEKMLYTTPPAINQGEYAETLKLLIPMKWSAFEKWSHTKVGHREKEYTELKDKICKISIEKIAKVYPDIYHAIDFIDSASPLTFSEYTGVRHGAMCGLRKEANDSVSFLPVSTKIPNLFLTGQNLNLHGFCGVMLTAIQTSEAIVGKDIIVNKLNEIQ